MKLLAVMTCALTLAFASSMTRAQAADPVLGTWTLDVAKSKFAGAAPKSTTRTYVAQGNATAMTVKSTSAEGKESTQTAILTYDGKDYAFTGAPGWDTVSARQAGPRSIKFTLKKAGKIVGHGTRTLSADGKTLTLKTKAVMPDGSKIDDTQVYTKQ